MERKSEWLSIETLRQDDTLCVAVVEVSGDEWLWADALRRNL